MMNPMLDIKFIREHADELRDAAAKKNLDPKLIDEVLAADKEHREAILSAETLRAEQKKAKDRESGAALKEKYKAAEEKLREAEGRFSALMIRVPNVISPDTPVGKSEDENKEVFRWGEPKKFDFEPKDHLELGKALDIIDFERGTKVAGFRGYYVKGDHDVRHPKDGRERVSNDDPADAHQGVRAVWQRLL